jgi:predicted Zn-dependent protease
MDEVTKDRQHEPTLAEMQGIPLEIGDAIAALAEAELEAGRVQIARAILEGLVVTNHEDATAWALLSQAHRRLDPEDALARLAWAESLLAGEGEREPARAELAGIAGDERVGPRARALLAALGE